MNTVLWILQVLLALKLLGVAYTHGILRVKVSVRNGSQMVDRKIRRVLSVTAMACILASLGLTLPGAFVTLRSITPVSAAAVAIMMIPAVRFHFRCRKKPNTVADLALIAIAAFTAYGRWILSPI
jgi:TRAP-type C4-dicarboxylate transport system permease small subunit